MRIIRFIAILLISFNVIAKEIKFPVPDSSLDKNAAVKNFSSNLLDLSKIYDYNLSFKVRDPETGKISDINSPVFVKKGKHYYYENSRLLGYEMSEKLVSAGCNLVDIKIPEDYFPPKPTDYMELSLNLSGNSTFIEKEILFDPANSKTFTFTTAYSIYDDLGKYHYASFYFVHSDINAWEVHVLVDDFNVGSGKLFFESDGSYGRNEGITIINFKFDGQTKQSIKLDFSESTQFASPSAINSVVQNGYRSGYAVFDEVNAGGYLTMHYDNNMSIVYAKVAVFTDGANLL